MAATVFTGLDGIAAAEGTEPGPTDWLVTVDRPAAVIESIVRYAG
jgi:hypothetical protein